MRTKCSKNYAKVDENKRCSIRIRTSAIALVLIVAVFGGSLLYVRVSIQGGRQGGRVLFLCTNDKIFFWLTNHVMC